MTVSTAEITAFVGAYIWVFARVSAMMMTAPIFSSQSFPIQFRITLAIACTLVMVPMLPPLPSVDFLSVESIVIMLNQIIIGSIMGFALQLIFSVLVLAGQILAMQAGLGFSMMNSPQDGVQITVVGQLYVMIATLLFLAMDGHLLLIQMIFDSFTQLPIGLNTIHPKGFWIFVSWGSEFYKHGVMVVMPAIAALLMVNISFGVMAKASPQLNPFSVGFVITIIFGFVIVLLSLPNMAPYFAKLVEEGFALTQAILLAK